MQSISTTSTYHSRRRGLGDEEFQFLCILLEVMSSRNWQAFEDTILTNPASFQSFCGLVSQSSELNGMTMWGYIIYLSTAPLFCAQLQFGNAQPFFCFLPLYYFSIFCQPTCLCTFRSTSTYNPNPLGSGTQFLKHPWLYATYASPYSRRYKCLIASSTITGRCIPWSSWHPRRWRQHSVAPRMRFIMWIIWKRCQCAFPATAAQLWDCKDIDIREPILGGNRRPRGNVRIRVCNILKFSHEGCEVASICN